MNSRARRRAARPSARRTSTTSSRVRRSRGTRSNPKRARRFTTGTTCPRENTTPSTNGGAFGTGVICSTISHVPHLVAVGSRVRRPGHAEQDEGARGGVGSVVLADLHRRLLHTAARIGGMPTRSFRVSAARSRISTRRPSPSSVAPDTPGDLHQRIAQRLAPRFRAGPRCGRREGRPRPGRCRRRSGASAARTDSSKREQLRQPNDRQRRAPMGHQLVVLDHAKRPPIDLGDLA